MKKYEYKILKTKPEGFWKNQVESEKLEGEINNMGSEGWELVSVMDTNMGHGHTNEILLFFKRESRF